MQPLLSNNFSCHVVEFGSGTTAVRDRVDCHETRGEAQWKDGVAHGARALDAHVSIHIVALGNVDVAVLAPEDAEPLVREHPRVNARATRRHVSAEAFHS